MPAETCSTPWSQARSRAGIPPTAGWNRFETCVRDGHAQSH
jgi:hypothetical protein